MQLQRIEFPAKSEQERENMYLRAADGCWQIAETGGLHVSHPGFVRFDTYFNAFSIEKWKRYTKLEQLEFCFDAEGCFALHIWNACRAGDGKVSREKVAALMVHDTERKEYSLTIPLEHCDKGILYAEIETQEAEGAAFYSGEYRTRQCAEREVSLALVICTYKRETYLYRNLDIIREQLWENPKSCLYHKIQTIVVDNGQTIAPERAQEGLSIYPNKNAGGTAGFTRGMLEARKHGGFTHVLLMDDDVEIKPSALERTYTLLCMLEGRYQEAMIGGAMLRLDYSFIQQESGGRYEAGHIRALHAGLDLREAENVLRNEEEEAADYNAWWYCCIPMCMIEDRGLPLPLFIHDDDAEYGLRCRTEIIRMNGICVWHEAFEHKRPSANEYYDVRNAMIVNALYGHDEHGKRAIRMACRRMLTNLFRYRYRDMRLVERAVCDFMKGPEWLMRQDAEQLHQKILASGYRYSEACAVSREEKAKNDLSDILTGRHNSNQIDKKKLISLNGWLLPAKGGDEPAPIMAGESPHAYYRKRKVWIYDPDTNLGFYTEKETKELFAFVAAFFRIYLKLQKSYRQVQTEYRTCRQEMCSEEFWKRYLELGGKENENKL